MGSVAVVTDSTADLPRELAEELGIRVVPLSVTFGTETFISGVSIDPPRFYERLVRSPELPTTSQPTPAWFEEAYADCVDEGHACAVSLHVSGALSGTVSLARDRARRAELDVEVVDTRLVGAPLGLVALAAQRAADAGGDMGAVLGAAERAAERVTSLLVVDTLDYLRRGGRLSGTQAMVGNVLRVKPLLHLVDGRVEVRERTRTWSRALDRVADLVSEAAAGAPVDVVVAHAVAEERAAHLWERIEDRVEVASSMQTMIGPVVGTHVGPGALSVAAIPSEPS
jgi:DegV family protein with EDD domain